MKLIIYYTDKIIKQLYENVANVTFDGSNLSFTSNSTPYNFSGFQHYYSEIDDTSTLQVGNIVTDADVLTFVKSQKHIEIANDYLNALVQDVTSTLLDSNGNYIVFSYAEKDQLNYNKIGTLFALNTNLTSHVIGSKSIGAYTITRSDFITLINDFDTNETNLYNKFSNLRTQIDNATTVDQVNAITW